MGRRRCSFSKMCLIAFHVDAILTVWLLQSSTIASRAMQVANSLLLPAQSLRILDSAPTNSVPCCDALENSVKLIETIA